MKIGQINKLSEKGHRQVNEDFLLAMENHSANEWFFGVYDGVGGNNDGEVASKLTAESTEAFIKKMKWPAASDNFFSSLYDFVDSQFDALPGQKDTRKPMSTTAVTVYLKNNTAYVHSIGDSRFFLIREGKIFFASRPDSLVYEMFEQGNITEEEMKVHQMKNVITKAIQSGSKTPLKNYDEIHTLKKGDIFFLCSDGVLEANDENEIARLSAKTSLYTLYDIILKNCREKSKDNYTAILFDIDSVLENTHVAGKQRSATSANGKNTKSSSVLRWLLTLAVMVFLIYLFVGRKRENELTDKNAVVDRFIKAVNNGNLKEAARLSDPATRRSLNTLDSLIKNTDNDDAVSEKLQRLQFEQDQNKNEWNVSNGERQLKLFVAADNRIVVRGNLMQLFSTDQKNLSAEDVTPPLRNKADTILAPLLPVTDSGNRIR